MTPPIGETVSDSEFEQNEGARPINESCGRGEDIIIAGAVSEWVLTGLQQWRKVARQSSRTFDLLKRPRAGGDI